MRRHSAAVEVALMQFDAVRLLKHLPLRHFSWAVHASPRLLARVRCLARAILTVLFVGAAGSFMPFAATSGVSWTGLTTLAPNSPLHGRVADVAISIACDDGLFSCRCRAAAHTWKRSGTAPCSWPSRLG